jgi:transcriptional regulator GlxA family with amidase domain
MPFIEIALAAGFADVRRFNDSSRANYRSPPPSVRKRA